MYRTIDNIERQARVSFSYDDSSAQNNKEKPNAIFFSLATAQVENDLS